MIAEQKKNPPNFISHERETELSTIAILSYKFSQGSAELQEYMLFWLMKKNFFKKEEILHTLSSLKKKLKPPKRHEEISQPPSVDIGDRIISISQDTKLRHATTPFLESEILQMILLQDVVYQSSGRPKRKDPAGIKVVPDSEEDKYASYLRRYALIGHSTGHPSYDLLFSTVKRMLKKLRENTNPQFREHRVLYEKLIFDWERNHPGHSFFPKTT